MTRIPLLFLLFFGLLAACQPATPVTTAIVGPTTNAISTATASSANTALPPSETPQPPHSTATPPPTATATNEIPDLPTDVIPPPLLYITNTQLIQYQLDGTMQVITNELGESEIWDAIQIANDVFLLRPEGIYRVGMSTGETDLVVPFEKTGDYGGLTKVSNEKVFFYSIVGISGCGETDPTNRIGFYQVDTSSSTVILENERNIGILGFSSDGQSFYGIPWGCDPSIGEYWEISMTDGEVIRVITAWEETSNLDFGYGAATLAPNGQFWAYLTEQPNGLGVYFPDEGIYKRYDLPNPPSHFTNLVGSPDSRQLYFVLYSGHPWEYPANPHGLWRFDVDSGTFSQVSDSSYENLYLHFVTEDNQWVFLSSTEGSAYLYIHLPTGQIFMLDYPLGGIGRIIR